MDPTMLLRIYSTALVATGLHDDAAGLEVRFSQARRDLDAATDALASLETAFPEMRGVLADLDAVATSLRATRDVEWRSVAAREYMDAVADLHGAAAELVEQAGEWLVLRHRAEREAEDVRADAQRRLDEAHAATMRMHEALAVAA